VSLASLGGNGVVLDGRAPAFAPSRSFRPSELPDRNLLTPIRTTQFRARVAALGDVATALLVRSFAESALPLVPSRSSRERVKSILSGHARDGKHAQREPRAIDRNPANAFATNTLFRPNNCELRFPNSKNAYIDIGPHLGGTRFVSELSSDHGSSRPGEDHCVRR
jgi:hypothetical protein